MHSRPLTLLVFSLLILRANAAPDGWHNIEISATPGPYTTAQWKADWPGCEYEDGISEGRLSTTLIDGSAWLRIAYAAGKIGPDGGGCGWRWPYTAKLALSGELRYSVIFDKDFEFVRGGKMPGLCGGPKTITGGDAVNGHEGWSARVMWRKDGRGQAYVYHMNQPRKYGDEFDFPADFRFTLGQPIDIRMRVTMNTLGQRDGKLRVWVTLPSSAERLLVDRPNMQWRAAPQIGVDSLLFNTFHGGSDDTWAPQQECHAMFGAFAWKTGDTQKE